MHRSDWPELLGMARTKESAQRYQTTLSAAILLAEVVGWERDYPLTCLHFVDDVIGRQEEGLVDTVLFGSVVPIAI